MVNYMLNIWLIIWLTYMVDMNDTWCFSSQLVDSNSR